MQRGLNTQVGVVGCTDVGWLGMVLNPALVVLKSTSVGLCTDQASSYESLDEYPLLEYGREGLRRYPFSNQVGGLATSFCKLGVVQASEGFLN